MGKRTHGPHLIHAIETNDHGKVHEVLAVQVRSKAKIKELCTADVRRLASDHYDCPLMVAASIPDPSIIKYLISKHGVDVNFVYKQGSGKRTKTSTPLLHAVRRGLYATVDVLLKLNVDANFQDHKGRSALHHAVKKANYKMSKMLLSRGAQPNVTDNGNNAALHIATKYGHVELAKLLLQYSADVYKRGHFGGLPIHIAAKEGHIALVQLFCAHEVSVNTKVPCYTDLREKSPLHVAAEEGHKEMVLALIEEFGAEVNIPDSEGETSLHCTVLNEYDPYGMKSKDDFVDSAKIIIQCGADVNLRNGRGETPLHLAARNEFQKVVELLIVAGADPLIEDNDKNKPVDLVSDDDTVSQQALKRAVTDREKYVSQLLESRARGLSNSITSMPSRMMGSMTSLNYGGQPINLSRTMSNPVLFGPAPGEPLIYQDGYLRAVTPRDRLASIGSIGDPVDPFDRMARAGSMRSLQTEPLAFDRIQRPGSMRSLHSTGYHIPGSSASSVIYARMEDPYARIDNSDAASMISESTIISGVDGQRQVKRKTSSELNRLAGRHPGDISSDSSQYDEIPPSRQRYLANAQPYQPQRHLLQNYTSTPLKNNTGYQGIGEGHPAAIYQSQAQMGALAELTQERENIANSPAITEPSFQDEVTPHASFSTFQDTNKSHNTETPVAKVERISPQAPLAQPETEEEEEAVYQNMPADEPQPVAPAAKPPMLKPISKPAQTKPVATPPMLKPRPKETSSWGNEVQKRQQQVADQMREIQEKNKSAMQPIQVQVPSHATQASHTAPTKPQFSTKSQASPKYPTTSAEVQTKSEPKITLKISPKQTLTLTPSKEATPSASSMTQEWRQLPEQMLANQNLDDSDDTFFDDASFDTLSDSAEALDKPAVKANPTPDVSQPMPSNKADDPKFQSWIKEQANFIRERQSSHEDSPGSPQSPSTPAKGADSVGDENSNYVKKKTKTDGKKKKKSKTGESDEKKPSVKPKPSPKPLPRPGVKVLPSGAPQPAARQVNKPIVEAISSDPQHMVAPASKAASITTGPPNMTASEPPKGEASGTPGSQIRTSVSEGEDLGTYWEHEESGTLRLNQSNNKQKPECEYIDMGSPTSEGSNAPQIGQEQPVVQTVGVSGNTSTDVQSGPEQVNHLSQPAMTELGSKIMNEYQIYKSNTDVNAASPEGIQQKIARRLSDNNILDTGKPPASPNRSSSGSRSSQFSHQDNPGPAATRGSQSSLPRQVPPSPTQPLPPTPPEEMSDHKEGVYEELPTPKRKVTIGNEEIIPHQRRSSRESELRTIAFDSHNKVRVAVVGGNSEGIYVHRIDPGSEADQQGLLEGDQIQSIQGKSIRGKTKEDVIYLLMSLPRRTELTVRYKRERYERVVKHGGMGDSFYVRACFTYLTTQASELKINEGDVFSVRDTMPDGKMGSWQALKLNARPSEAQHGLIPNQARAEQVALAAKTKENASLKDERGGFLRRSLRRAKSAERLHKESEAMNRNVAPVVGGDIKAYEWVEQKPPGFIRPVILIGLFSDAVRDRLMNDELGKFEVAPPEVEIPGARDDSNIKVPVNLDIIEGAISRDRHCLMIVSPRTIQYLLTTTLQPIVIYLAPGSKSIIKTLRTKLAPGFERRSSFMYDEALQFSKQYSRLFTATVTYTVDDSWFMLLKDTISRIQNQPIWQPVAKSRVLEDNYESDLSMSMSETSPQHQPSKAPQMRPLANKQASPQASIPDPIMNMLHKHSGDISQDDVFLNDEGGMGPPPNTTLTYDGYFLSDSANAPPKGASTPHNQSVGDVNIMNYMINGAANRSMDTLTSNGHDTNSMPKSILKKRGSNTSVDGILQSPTHYQGPRANAKSASSSDLLNYPMQNGYHPAMVRQPYGMGNTPRPQVRPGGPSPHIRPGAPPPHPPRGPVPAHFQRPPVASRPQRLASNPQVGMSLYDSTVPHQPIYGNLGMNTPGLPYDWQQQLAQMYTGVMNPHDLEALLRDLELRTPQERAQCVQEMIALWHSNYRPLMML